MASSFATFERDFFRRINSIVEPAVRFGIGSPRRTPASLVVLETTGFKSGQQRRTPLWSLKLGKYRLLSTARGERSFWVKNLQKKPKAIYYVGGKPRLANAVVLTAGETGAAQELPGWLQRLTGIFERYTARGWAFAILAPANH